MSQELIGVFVIQTFGLILSLIGLRSTYIRFAQQIKIDTISVKGEANLDNANALTTMQEGYVKMSVLFMESNARVMELHTKMNDMDATMNAQSERISLLEKAIEAERAARIDADKTSESLRALLEEETRKRHKLRDENDALKIEIDRLKASQQNHITVQSPTEE